MHIFQDKKHVHMHVHNIYSFDALQGARTKGSPTPKMGVHILKSLYFSMILLILKDFTDFMRFH